SFLLTGVHFLFYMHMFRYSALSELFLPDMQYITERSSAIFEKVAEIGTITEKRSVIPAVSVLRYNRMDATLHTIVVHGSG
ncbi:hypothetical protein, partial [Paenibacillus hemerocallicola]|uniref:hypothetical protein n=1 Tax=Paenibacillus hemerocallicola TaxID=1172614 RepID=UPI001C407208